MLVQYHGQVRAREGRERKYEQIERGLVRVGYAPFPGEPRSAHERAEGPAADQEKEADEDRGRGPEPEVEPLVVQHAAEGEGAPVGFMGNSRAVQ